MYKGSKPFQWRNFVSIPIQYAYIHDLGRVLDTLDEILSITSPPITIAITLTVETVVITKTIITGEHTGASSL